jgi:hypothetical protein
MELAGFLIFRALARRQISDQEFLRLCLSQNLGPHDPWPVGYATPARKVSIALL